MYGIGYISHSVNQTLTPSATLGAPGDMYIITDTRQRPRKDLSETKAFQRFDIRTLNAEELAKMQAEDPLLYEQIKADMSTSGNVQPQPPTTVSATATPDNLKDFIVNILSENGYTNGKDYTIKYFKSSPYWANRGQENVQECWIKANYGNAKIDQYDVEDFGANSQRLVDYICGLVDTKYKYKYKGLGKPTIKLEFKDNADLMSLFDTDGISGMTVNDKPADIFNCPESQLQTRGYRPTYQILANYDYLVDPSDGRKTLKGYGFEKTTLDELVNACRYYPQVAALAAHLKDPNGDPLQSAFNIWHWLHTNVRYDYDAPGEEEIRTPARAYADRNSGIDCDCLAVLTACLLINQGFHPCFEIVAFNNEPTFSHIYVNLDGAAIDRVLPVFLARPDNITKTQIMDIPVYALSGIGGCRDTLSGVYASTLAKIQQGTATAEDNNDFRKTQVLVTLRGVNDAAYQLAALLMPYVVTVADDGTYYFDSTALANLATKLDADLRELIADDADPETISQWIATAAQQIDGAASVQSNGGKDTIVVIINPQGNMTRVIGQMVKASTPTLTATTAAATSAAQTPAAASSTPAIMQTSPMPGVSPDGETESDSSDWWKYALAAAAAFGAGAMVAKSGKKKKHAKARK